MGAMWLPTLAGFAHLIPVAVNASPTNVGANWSLVLYTVPTGRAAIITTAYMTHDGGTAPTVMLMQLRNAADATLLQPIRRVTFTQDDLEPMQGTLFMAEGDDINFLIVTGDDTTDMDCGISGAEFDWVEPDSFL